MASFGSPTSGLGDQKMKAYMLQLNTRMKECWKASFDWETIPQGLKEGCHQVGTAISMPPLAVLAGLLVVVGFCMSHSVVTQEGTDWVEPVLAWIAICMPTGAGKSSLCKFLRKLINRAHEQCGLDDSAADWLLDDQSFEKMGESMQDNHWKLLGLFDELSMFLTQINISKGRGLSDSHELAVLLQLYGGDPWKRRTVSGDANFSMKHTGLTIGGFTQPFVARNLIDVQANVEKGLCQRFLWIVPEPNLVAYEQMCRVDEDFTTGIVTLMSSLWVSTHSKKTWILKRPSEVFKTLFDTVQTQLYKISCMDDFLSGMISKSKGQVLRLGAVFHALFNMDNPLDIPDTISEDALKAACAFVSLCNQHAAYIAGRGGIPQAIAAIEEAQKEMFTSVLDKSAVRNTAKFSLELDGKVLQFKALNTSSLRKFRDRGNKKGARMAWTMLQDEGLGRLVGVKPNRGTDMLIEFHKAPVPENSDEKIEFAGKLMKFGISLAQYKTAFEEPDIIIPEETETTKVTTPTRVSPRKKKLPEDMPTSSKKVLKLD